VTDNSPNRISPTTDGPFHVQGDIRVVADQGDTVFEGAETWLCRCGHSANKPFCDGSRMAGPYVLTAPDGTTCDVADKGSLCRCGLSQTKPMCDGTHKGSDFEG